MNTNPGIWICMHRYWQSTRQAVHLPSAHLTHNKEYMVKKIKFLHKMIKVFSVCVRSRLCTLNERSPEDNKYIRWKMRQCSANESMFACHTTNQWTNGRIHTRPLLPQLQSVSAGHGILPPVWRLMVHKPAAGASSVSRPFVMGLQTHQYSVGQCATHSRGHKLRDTFRSSLISIQLHFGE